MPVHQLVLGGGGGGGGVLGSLLGAVPGGSAVASLLSPVAAPLAIAGAVLADPVGSVLGPVAGIASLATGLVGLEGIGVPAQQANGVVDTTGFGGGNGRTATRTIVQTMDLATGQIIRMKTMPGSPRLMNSDVAAARKVIKSVGKLHNQMPRRTVKESQATKLKDAAIAAALAKTQQIEHAPKC